MKKLIQSARLLFNQRVTIIHPENANRQAYISFRQQELSPHELERTSRRPLKKGNFNPDFIAN